MVLPSSDIWSGSTSEVISAGRARLRANLSQPFQFTGDPSENTLPTSELKPQHLFGLIMNQNSLVLENLTDQAFIEAHVREDQVSIKSIKGCVIYLGCSFSSSSIPCQIENVHSSIILVKGSMTGSLSCIKNLVIIADCHQLRLNNVTHCSVLGRVVGKEIILEKCAEIKFGSWTEGKILRPGYSVNDIDRPGSNAKDSLDYFEDNNLSIEELIVDSFSSPSIYDLWRDTTDTIRNDLSL